MTIDVARGQAATESHTLLALAVQHCVDGLIIVDEAGRILMCNPRAIEMLLLPPDAVGKRLDDLLGRTADGDMSTDGSFDVGFATGAMVEISAAAVAGGRVLTCRDVSGARHAQMRLAECELKFGALEEKFNEVIGSVMREMTERQNRANDLAAAKAVAEAATEAKSAFLASMSHEVRTPLNGVIGFAELLLDDDQLSGSARQIAMKIRSAGNALLSVVNDILDFSEIESGGVVLNREDFSLTTLIDAALEIIEPQVIKKGLELHCHIDPAIAPQFEGDEGRLRQVLLNILNNAVKFTDKGSIKVSVTCTNAGREAQTLRFEVADSGIGIPADKRDRLFERFSQVDSSVRRKFGGTGLGLAISKQLVQLMGGRIGFESFENHGSVFWFVVKLDTAGDMRPARAPEPIPVAEGRRVLVVEDVEMNGEIAKAMISAAGYRVDVVVDGASAIDAVKAVPYDLVLMDIQMPDMDGITATQHIRRLGGSAGNVPIVAMTAHVIPREVERFLAAGMNGHIGKPFKRAELEAKIAAWCAPALAPV